MIKPHQKELIEFLVTSGALTFGDFTLKSGRKSPYFMNTGNFNDGQKIAKLASVYASHLWHSSDRNFNVIFGPAYKGIPLAVSTALTLSRDFGQNVGFSFNRKEAKDHGDTGMLVGHQLTRGDRVVLVEDVISAGTTLREVVPLLLQSYHVALHSVVILLDRGERGIGTRSAVEELEQSLSIRIDPIVSIHSVLDYLWGEARDRFNLDSQIKVRIEEYLEQYGA